MTTFLVIAILAGLYMSWNIGANDAANAIGTSVGSGALTLGAAVLIAAVFEFAGAFLFGSSVSETLQEGIVIIENFRDTPNILAKGMLSALLATGLWLQIASYFRLPVSTSHSIVGAIIGFGLVNGGVETLHLKTISTIGLGWVISPLLGASFAYLIFTNIRKKIFFADDPVRATKKCMPYIVAFSLTTFSTILILRGLHGVEFSTLTTLFTISAIGLISFFTTKLLLLRALPINSSPIDRAVNPSALTALNKSIKHLNRLNILSRGKLQYQTALLLEEANNLKKFLDQQEQKIATNGDFNKIEKIFARLQIITACFMAFSHGANDVANAIGPLSACIAIILNGFDGLQNQMSPYVLMLGGVGIILGLTTWGWRVIETIGKKITELTPSRAFAAELGASTTVAFASSLGLPISTTHTLVGAIFGIGIARGMYALNTKILKEILYSWIITIPAGALLSVVFFKILMAINL